jgi:NAD(P)-dependent dehydrogenase (short-subunit alcohol dehydrogenase family)
MVLEFGKGDKAQVAIVTGAARGLGKAWAIALAKKGVKVVVNDNDPDRRLVDQVVTHIGSHGGIAIADYNSVSEGDKIVENALKNFSRVDILINVKA